MAGVVMSDRCLHVSSTFDTKKGYLLPYRAHLRMKPQIDPKIEDASGINIEFDHERCTVRAQNWMMELDPAEEQALYQAVAHEAASIYNQRRHNGLPIDGEDRAS